MLADYHNVHVVLLFMIVWTHESYGGALMQERTISCNC
uniref:Uncharacterized protein n=1 Tax=Arundo donax TaxID=35708 RepID=A0A0A9FT55_ARUDO